jgi:hypothetical protein
LLLPQPAVASAAAATSAMILPVRIGAQATEAQRASRRRRNAPAVITSAP